ncbi:MAG: hypothetical protein DYG98_26520 [Haliscomenobacteraceae bacterium CHB4]|nr:hypothetical protein [Saprospiraceae bacterium]MCE7926613.1 hypothetical protein [Haliscomenobacteraceae bacterium CHB4]
MPAAALRRIPFNDVESEFMQRRRYKGNTFVQNLVQMCYANSGKCLKTNKMKTGEASQKESPLSGRTTGNAIPGAVLVRQK